SRLRAGNFHLLHHSLTGAHAKASVFQFFLPKSFYHANRGEGFVQHQHRGTVEFLYAIPAFARATAGLACQIEERGGETESDRGQYPVDARRHVEHAQKTQAGGDERDNSLQEDELDGGRIVLNAVRDIIGATPVMEEQAHALRMPEEMAAEI